MYGQVFAKELAGRLTEIRYQLLQELGKKGDVWPEEPFVSAALSAAFRVHQGAGVLWRHSQRPELGDKPADPIESTGQYDPPAADPNPTMPELRVRLVLWLEKLEESLAEKIHLAHREAPGPQRNQFIDTAVVAARRIAQARQVLSEEGTRANAG